MYTMELKKELITLGGDKIKTLTFDFDNLTPTDYRQIVRLEANLKGSGPLNFEYSSSKKTSTEFRMATAWIAAVKGTKGLCVDDFERLTMLDLLGLEENGLLFITECLE